MFNRFYLKSSLLLLCLASVIHLTAADYYWIGGSGSWSDISHWATTDGGATTHSQAPTANDDVFFTANSFNAGGQTVTLNTDIAFCRNLSFAGVTNNPTLIGPESTTFTVFGSWQLDPGMTYDFDGQMVFTGDQAGNTLDFANHSAGQTITFSGSGDWTLNGTLSVDSTFIFQEGTLNTNGQDVICGYFHSMGTAVRNLTLANSEIIVTNSTYRPFENAWYNRWFFAMHLDATNLTIDPGTSVLDFRGSSIELLVEGTGSVDFNRVVLSAPMGVSSFPFLRPFYSSENFPNLNFGELDLHHRTAMAGDVTVGNLILYPGQAYTFESDRTLILGGLQASGDCTESIDLMGTDATIPATFSSANPITTDYVSLQSIGATGGGAFTANNAVDLGNNTGWTINEKPSEAFYWVGGTGNWNDPAHWSATSGGGSNGCVPSVTDDVFFDGNSFTAAGQSVTINVENANCRNMSWDGVTGTPNLTGPMDHRLRIAGSLQLAENMDHSFLGNYLFSSNQMGNTIVLNHQRLHLDAVFAGGGEWIFQDSFHTEEALVLMSGTLRTNDQAVNAQFLRSDNQQVRGLFLGSSHLTLEAREGNLFFTEMIMNSTNLTFDAGTSVIEFLGGYGSSTFFGGGSVMDFNVILFNTPRGTWRHNFFDQMTGQRLVPNIDSLIYYFNGSLETDNNINYLRFQGGHTYDLGVGYLQNVGELVADGNCEGGLVSMRTFLPGDSARIQLPPGQVFEGLNLIDIEVIGGVPTVANNSVDGGGNYGWAINETSSRDLYWVGDSGEWYDISHWSLSSGGPGGECVPTAADNVFFDGNSTTQTFLEIYNQAAKIAYCKDINWAADIPVNTGFYIGELACYGNFFNAGDLQFGSQVKFNGVGDYSIRTGGSQLGFVEMRGNGEYTFVDDLNAGQIWHYTGTVTFANETARLGEYRVRFGDDPKVLNLGDAHLILERENLFFDYAFWVENESNLTLNPGNSLIEVTALAGAIRADDNIRLHDVIFSNPMGGGIILSEDQFEEQITTNSVTFNGNGELELELTTDTLICAPGKSYVFAANKTQRIEKYWQLIGNNCTPISLSSSMLGTQATVSMPAEAEILADFVQMQNSTGVGGAEFLAGSRSTNIANSNVNWVFETSPQFQEVGFLGEDRAICVGEPVTLNAYNFSPGESYVWQDGSTDTTFTTNQSGFYSVQVTFQTNCVVRDTVEILDAQAFTVDLPDNPVICAGDTLTLSADAGINSAGYVWQDGSGERTFGAFAEGQYSVVVDLGGCTETDTTFLTVTPLPTVDLGQDQIACAGEDFSITATVSAESFRWQDGSTDQMFSGDQPGTYWVEATNGGCSVRDSVVVAYVDAGAVELGSDTVVCVAERLLLDAGIAGANYTWQDGSNGQTFEASATGQYFVQIEISGCTASDTINVEFPDLPTLDVVPGYEECEGTTFLLTTMTAADSYAWSNGQTGPNFSTDMAGSYELVATIGSCTVSQDFDVSFLAPPVVELGNDTVLCTAPSLVLNAGQTGVWQDGSSSATFTVTSSGQYFVDVSNGACTVSDTINVNFADQNAVDLDDSYARCQGETFNFSSMAAADSFSWSNGQTGPDFSTNVAGPYQLEAVFGTCTVTRDFTVDFLAPPVVELGPDTAACTGTPVVLNAGQAGVWQDGSTSATFTATTPGRYRVAVSNAGCTTEDSLEVSFLALPEFSLGDDQTGCEGELLTVNVPAGLGQVVWDDGTANELTRDFTDSGIRWVEITDGNDCVARDSVNLTISPLPLLELGPDTTVCDDVPFTLIPTTGAGQLFWPDGSGGPEFVVPNPGRIIAVINDEGCLNSDTIQVQFRDCVYFQAYLPTAFSPNFDGINDVFAPGFDEELEILSYKLQVFSRWGDQLFVSEDIDTPWDGAARGKVLDVGVYLYVIEVSYVDDRGMGSEVLTGDLTLLR